MDVKKENTSEDIKSENIDYRTRIQEILNSKSTPNQPSSKFKNFIDFFREHDSVKSHVQTIQNHIRSYEPNQFSVLSEVAGKGIAFSFFEWFASATIFASLLWAGAKSTALKIGAFLNDGLTGSLISLGSVAIGMIVGGCTYAFKTKDEIQAKKDQLREKYKQNQAKLAILEKIECQNIELEQLGRSKGKDLPILLKPHDDRGLRRLTTEKTPFFTTFKKTMNRFCVAIGKAGSGILLFRSIPMVALPLLTHIPFLAHVGFMVAVSTAVSAVAWPVTLAAMGIGIIWAGIYTYRYIRERKLASAERLLNDVDNRLRLAKKNQNILLNEMGCGDLIAEQKIQRKKEVVFEDCSKILPKKDYENEVVAQLTAPRTYEDGNEFYHAGGIGEKSYTSDQLRDSLLLSSEYNNLGNTKNNLAHLAIIRNDNEFYNRLIEIVGSEDHDFFHTENAEGKTAFDLRAQKEPSIKFWALAKFSLQIPLLGCIGFLAFGAITLACKLIESNTKKDNDLLIQATPTSNTHQTVFYDASRSEKKNLAQIYTRTLI